MDKRKDDIDLITEGGKIKVKKGDLYLCQIINSSEFKECLAGYFNYDVGFTGDTLIDIGLAVKNIEATHKTIRSTKMPCKHSHLALIYAQQMAEMDQPWKLWEFRTNEYELWNKCGKHPEWKDGHEYRQIPKTIKINGFDVPEPMREKPDYGTYVWAIDALSEDGVYKVRWYNSKQDAIALKRGSLHLTFDNCIAHAKALFSFSEIKE